MLLVALGLWMSLDEDGLNRVAASVRSRDIVDNVSCPALRSVGLLFLFSYTPPHGCWLLVAVLSSV